MLAGMAVSGCGSATSRAEYNHCKRNLTQKQYNLNTMLL